METLTIFRETIGASMCLTLDSLHVKMEHTEEKGNHTIWFENDNRSSYLRFNPQTRLASEYGKVWEEPTKVIEKRIFKQLNQ